MQIYIDIYTWVNICLYKFTFILIHVCEYLNLLNHLLPFAVITQCFWASSSLLRYVCVFWSVFLFTQIRVCVFEKINREKKSDMCLCVCVFVCIYMCVYRRICMCIYMYIYIHIYVHIMYIHMHIYMHGVILVSPCWLRYICLLY